MDQDFQRRLPMLLNERESFIFHNTAKHKRNNITFVVRSGVRQGGILSPILFNVYVNDLVNNLVDKDCGCHVQFSLGVSSMLMTLFCCHLHLLVCKQCLMFVRVMVILMISFSR